MDAAFRDAGISIAYPQRDVHLAGTLTVTPGGRRLWVVDGDKLELSFEWLKMASVWLNKPRARGDSSRPQGHRKWYPPGTSNEMCNGGVCRALCRKRNIRSGRDCRFTVATMMRFAE